MTLKIFVSIFCLSIISLLPAQEIYLLDLPTCLKMATEKNFQMRQLRENLAQSEFRLQSATNRFKTHINLNINAPVYTETVSRFEDSLGVYFYPIRRFNYNSQLEIIQPLPTDGRLYVRSGIYALEDYEVDRNTVQFITRVGISQPLESFYSYNELQSNLRSAELDYEIKQKQLTRAELDINYQVSAAFYELIAAIEREKIAVQTLQAQQESTELAKNKYAAGVIAEVEALQMEVDLAQELNNFDIAHVERTSQENYLKQLLDISLSDSINVTSDLSYNIVSVDMDQAIESGLRNRLEIREKEIERELAELEISRVRVQGQITGAISAYYDFIGVSSEARYLGMPNTIDNAWRELLRRPGNKGVELSITFPIWDWGVNSADVQAARANLRKTDYSLDNEKVGVEREIRDLVARFNSSLRRLKILEANINLARKSFEISKDRFARGEIDSQALALDRNRASNAYLTHLQAYISYKLLLLDLARKTFYDFENKRSLTEEKVESE